MNISSELGDVYKALRFLRGEQRITIFLVTINLFLAMVSAYMISSL